MGNKALDSEAARSHLIRYRLRGQLSYRRWTLGKNWTQSQGEAWLLLNEGEELIEILELLTKGVWPENQSEVACRVRHKVLMHQASLKPRE